MKILGAYNIKGGVGKTAAAVNLSYLAAAEGAKALFWDLDPQGAATYYFRVAPQVKGTKKILRGKKDLAGAIKGTDYEGLDLLPADFSYRHMDVVLDGTKQRERRLRKILEPLAKEYDFVFLDCPPSISLVSEAVFRAAQVLLVPVIPTTLSVHTLEQLISFRQKSGLDDLLLLPFFSMVDRRKKLHRTVMQTLPREFEGVLAAAIPYSSEVEQMGIHRAPLGSYAGRGRAARAYGELWDEIKVRIG